MSHAGVAYGAVVLLGYDRWLLKTLRSRHQERLLRLTLMLVMSLQGAVALLAVVRLAAAIHWQR